MRILVVEDEPIISLNLQSMLVDLGHRPISAASVREAEAAVNERRFDAAILDVTLPDGDSFALAKSLVDRQIPILFATASLMEGRHDFPLAPMISKPFDVVMLEEALAALASPAGQNSAPVAPATVPEAMAKSPSE